MSEESGATKDVRSRLDIIEKVILLVCFTHFVWRVVERLIEVYDSTWLELVIPSLLLVSESTVLILTILRKRTTNISARADDWFLAFAVTLLPIFVSPAVTLSPLIYLAFPLVLSGIAWQIYAKVVLGTRFGVVPANRGICARGPYRIVRHPIYFGYMLSHIGFLLATLSWWNLGCYVVLYCLMIPRILAEERLLRQDQEYRDYMGKVRYRLLPFVF